MSSHSSKYGAGVVILQASTTRPSSVYSTGSSASRSSSSYSTYSSSSQSTSMDSSNYSSSSRPSVTSGRYRTGSSSAGFYTDVREVKTRKGNDIVVVHHNRSSTATDEPRSSDYHGSRSSRT